MTPISISNCPVSGLQRKVVYDFTWHNTTRQIIISCYVSYYKDGVPVETAGLRSYKRDLVASDSYVDISTGAVLTQEQITANNLLKSKIQAHANWQIQYDNWVILDSQYNEALEAYTPLLEEYNTKMLHHQHYNIWCAYNEALEEYNSKLEQHQNFVIWQEYNETLEAYNMNPSLEQPQIPDVEMPSPFVDVEVPNMPQIPDVEMPSPFVDVEVPNVPSEPIKAQNPGTEPENPQGTPINTMLEYDYYVAVIGSQPVVIPNIIEQIIHYRDLEGKFNI